MNGGLLITHKEKKKWLRQKDLDKKRSDLDKKRRNLDKKRSDLDKKRRTWTKRKEVSSSQAKDVMYTNTKR